MTPIRVHLDPSVAINHSVSAGTGKTNTISLLPLFSSTQKGDKFCLFFFAVQKRPNELNLTPPNCN